MISTALCPGADFKDWEIQSRWEEFTKLAAGIIPTGALGVFFVFFLVLVFFKAVPLPKHTASLPEFSLYNPMNWPAHDALDYHDCDRYLD